MERKYKIGGMACGGCVASVERALSSLPGVKSVKAELATGVVTINGDVDNKLVADTVESVGFDFIEVL